MLNAVVHRTIVPAIRFRSVYTRIKYIFGIMVLCKACDKYLELLNDELYSVQNEQDHDAKEIANLLHTV